MYWLAALVLVAATGPTGPGPRPGRCRSGRPGRPAEVGLDEALLQPRDYALTGGGSGYHPRRQAGDVVGRPEGRYDLKSSTKSFGATALGLAILDGKIALTDRALRHPGFGMPPESNAQTGWLDRITILHLATQTAGFEKPGGFEPLLFEPGTKWPYSDGGPNWLAECITLAYRRDVDELMFERVFTPARASRATISSGARTAIARSRSTASRGASSARASAPTSMRWRGSACLYLRGGQLGRQARSCPRDFVDAGRHDRARRGRAAGASTRTHYGKASDHYGLLWWNNADGTLDGRAARRLLVVGPVRQPDRRHSQPRPGRRPGRASRGSAPRRPAITTCCGRSSRRSSPPRRRTPAQTKDTARSSRRPIRPARSIRASTGRRPRRSSARPRAATTGR